MGVAEDFDDLVRRYRRELHVHCYRMLGSFDEAEDHVQEVFLRAWRSRERFQGGSSPRTWLYRIATNACLDTLRRDARRAVRAPSSASAGSGPSIAAMPWIQPYPDSLLEEMAADQPGPEAMAVSRETISLAFLATIQLLPPRQRAVLILRDVVSWPAAEVAGLLDMSVPAVNSALQRARTTLRDQWPEGRLDAAPAAEPEPGQRRLLHFSKSVGVIRVWQHPGGKLLARLEGIGSYLGGFSYAHSGRTIVAPVRDGTLHLWEAATGRQLHRLEGHGHVVRGLAFAPDCKRLAAACGDGSLRIWDVNAEKLIATIEVYFDSAVFTRDGKIVGADGKGAGLWDAETGRPLTRLAGLSGRLFSVAMSPNDIQTASCDQNACAGTLEIGVEIFAVVASLLEDQRADRHCDREVLAAASRFLRAPTRFAGLR